MNLVGHPREVVARCQTLDLDEAGDEAESVCGAEDGRAGEEHPEAAQCRRGGAEGEAGHEHQQPGGGGSAGIGAGVESPGEWLHATPARAHSAVTVATTAAPSCAWSAPRTVGRSAKATAGAANTHGAIGTTTLRNRARSNPRSLWIGAA